MFDHAVGFVRSKHYLNAIALFDKIAKEDKKAEYADDALVNAGLCYFQMGLYHDAMACFTRAIQAYPDAKIHHTTNGAQEIGRTAAKARLGNVYCHLALGDLESAKKEHEALKPYDDSYVVDAQGNKKTYYQIATETMATLKK